MDRDVFSDVAMIVAEREALQWCAEFSGRSVAAPGELLSEDRALTSLLLADSAPHIVTYYEWSIGVRPIDRAWRTSGSTFEEFITYRTQTVLRVTATRRRRLGGVPRPMRGYSGRRFVFWEGLNLADGATREECSVFGPTGIPSCDVWIGLRWRGDGGSGLGRDLGVVCTIPSEYEDGVSRALDADILGAVTWS